MAERVEGLPRAAAELDKTALRKESFSPWPVASCSFRHARNFTFLAQAKSGCFAVVQISWIAQRKQQVIPASLQCQRRRPGRGDCGEQPLRPQAQAQAGRTQWENQAGRQLEQNLIRRPAGGPHLWAVASACQPYQQRSRCEAHQH